MTLTIAGVGRLIRNQAEHEKSADTRVIIKKFLVEFPPKDMSALQMKIRTMEDSPTLQRIN